jgi:type IV secretory pathway VirB2 component (pilin)
MANEIKITSDAIKELRETLAKLELQFRATGNVTQYNDAVLKVRDSFVATNANAKNLSSQLVVIDNAMGKSANAMRGGIVSAIQELNAKVGNTRPLVTSMSQAMQDSAQFSFGAAQGIRAVANNIEMMVQQMTYLKSTGMSTGEIFKSMVATIKGPIGVLVAVSAFSAGLQWLTTYLQQSSRAAKELKENTKDLTADLTEMLYKLELITGGRESMVNLKQLELAGIRTKIAQAQQPVYSQRKGEERTVIGRGGIVAQIPATENVIDVKATIANEERVKELRIQEAAKMLEIQALNKEALKDEKEKTKELVDQNKLFLEGIRIRSAAFTRGLEDESRGVTYYGKGAAIGFNDVANFLRGRKGLIDTKPELKGVGGMSGGFDVEKLNYGMDTIIDKGKIFGDTLKHGIIESTNILTQRLMQALNLGDSLAAKIAGSVGGSLLSAGITTGLSYIPFVGPLLSGVYNATNKKAGGGWINEPVFGVGLNTRQTYAIGERGPEYVSPASSNRMGQQGRGGGMMQPIVNVYNRLTPTGLATTVEIGGNQLGKVRY